MKGVKLIGLMLFVLGSFPFSVWAQQEGTLQGRVTDASSGEPLPGVNVYLVGTTLGATTDVEGNYVIRQIPAGIYTVRASFVGYEPVSVDSVSIVEGQAVTLNFELKPQVVGLEEVVVVGYGTQRRIDVTSAVSVVAPEELQKRPVANLSEGLQGLVPGLTIIDRGGRPSDAGTMVYLRGRGSIYNNTTPLVLIDGVPGSLNDVDEDDVESITVLKDAAATAIYGSRAANGVILITTKRGRQAQGLNVTYDGYVGIQNVAHLPDRVDIKYYLELINQAYLNVGLDPKYSEEYIERTARGDDPLRYPDTDWLDIVFDPALIQDHNLTFSGGTDRLAALLSLNFMNQGGMIINTGAKRYSVRLNTDFKVSKRLNLSADLSLRKTWDKEPTQMGQVLYRMLHDTPPTVVARYPNGVYGWSDNGHNPLAYAKESGLHERSYLFGLVNVKAEYKLTNDITLTGMSYWQGGTWNEKTFQNEAYFYDYWNPDRLRKFWSPNYLNQARNVDSEWYVRGMAEYNKEIGEHTFQLMLGYEQTSHEWNGMSGGREDFYNNELQEINVGDPNRDWVNGNSYEWRLRSGFGRIRYDYKDRYLLEVNGRYDGSSRFARGRRFGFFPSVSLGWRISQEEFMSNLDFINEFKLRASWGKTGNQSIVIGGSEQYYPYWQVITLGHSYVLGDQLVNGAAQTQLANKEISWETTTTTGIGLDLELFNRRLRFVGDVYKKITDGILLNLPIMAIVGLDPAVQNAGKLQNTGWEFSLEWNDVWADNQGFYSIGVNLSDNKNKVVDLAGTGPYIDWIWYIGEGYPLGSMYGWLDCGLFQSEEQVKSYPVWHPETGPGDICYVDLNNDGVIDDKDKTVIGSDEPRYLLGVNLSASYKNIDVSAFFQGVLKVNVFTNGALVEGPYWENYTITEWYDVWTPDNPDGKMPAPRFRRTYNHQASTFWVRDASYIKLKNLQIGYTLPESLVNRWGISRMRIYLSGQNVLTFTKYPYLDPEVPSGRGTVYPQVRTFSLGITVNF